MATLRLDNLNALLNEVGRLYVVSIQQTMIRTYPELLDSFLIDSISYVANAQRGTVEVLINDYYRFVESGRRPMAPPPPVTPLLTWLIRKRIAPGQEARVVWAVRNAIAKRGIPPRPFLNTGTEFAERGLDLKITLSVGEALQAAFEGGLPPKVLRA